MMWTVHTITATVCYNFFVQRWGVTSLNMVLDLFKGLHVLFLETWFALGELLAVCQ